jgi:hypothetical protein
MQHGHCAAQIDRGFSRQKKTKDVQSAHLKRMQICMQIFMQHGVKWRR